MPLGLQQPWGKIHCWSDISEVGRLVSRAPRQLHLWPSGRESNRRPSASHCWATVCKTVSSKLSDRCPFCLSVTLVYCGQMVGRIKMPLGTEVDLGPGDIMLDGDPAPPLQKGGGALPMSIVAKRLDGQDGISWHGGGLWSRPHCARRRPSCPPQKGDRDPNFRPIFIVAKRLDASRCHLVWR